MNGENPSQNAGKGKQSARRLAVVLEYDGTKYHGFQFQVNAASIQGIVETAIERFTGERVRVNGAGRTDAGVHALGQVVAFGTRTQYGTDVFREALNHFLPDDVVVRVVREVPISFDPRRDARSRKYRYVILNRATPTAVLRRFAHWVGPVLDVSKMRRAAGLLEGRRDFAPFSGPVESNRSTVRRLFRTGVYREGDLVVLEVEGNAFLPQQVRRIAGALVEVGTGRMGIETFQSMADGNVVGLVPRVLPPNGLYLIEVTYSNWDDLS